MVCLIKHITRSKTFAYGSDALKRARFKGVRHMSNQAVKKYYPSIYKYKSLALICLVFFMFIAIISLLQSEWFAFFILIFFAALGLLMLAIASNIAISEEAIYVNSIFTKYKILWNEVELIEIGDWVLAFHGKGDKRLIVPTKWSGKDLENALKILDKQIPLYNIKEVHNGLADYKIHKNVRVKNV